MDTPETYGLPNAQNAVLPSRNNVPGYLGGAVTAIAGLVAGVLAFRSSRMSAPPTEKR
jgi:formate dehydrogenase iron-sulfur subunit